MAKRPPAASTVASAITRGPTSSPSTRSAISRTTRTPPTSSFRSSPRRYEQKAIVLTTNLAFRDWHTIFPNAACAVGLIDRLTHHSTIVKVTGESYRLREAERAQKARRTPAK